MILSLWEAGENHFLRLVIIIIIIIIITKFV